jgi:ABC-type amino acid transport substrate-binding protein
MSEINFNLVGPYTARGEFIIWALRVTPEFRALEQNLYENGYRQITLGLGDDAVIGQTSDGRIAAALSRPPNSFDPGNSNRSATININTNVRSETLAETPERTPVVDFILYSNTSVCMFGRADNPKFASAKTVDDLNSPDVTIAYFIGAAEEGWVKQRFPKAKFLGVANSGATAPLEDVMAKRADAAPINRIPYVPMARKVKGLASLPKENNCQGSTEKAQPVGVAIDKKQPEFLEWARAVEKSIHAQLVESEQKVIDTMK